MPAAASSGSEVRRCAAIAAARGVDPGGTSRRAGWTRFSANGSDPSSREERAYLLRRT